MPQIRNNSATLIFGDTGTGKSSLIATFAEYVWEKHQKVTLLYSVDGGGFGTSVETLVHAGIIWLWKLRSRGLAFETCARASQGYWPQQILNPITGEVAPACKLLPPVMTEYTLFCPNGHELKKTNDRRVFSSAILCTKCNTNTGIKNGKIEATSIRTPGMENVGAAAFDGLTSMQGWIMIDMGQRTASGELKGEETALGGKITSGDMHFGGSNRAHYGQAQLRAEDWILDSTAIPGLVAAPVWTALEQRANDRDTKLPVYGPKVAGAAKTSDVPSWVGNCLGTRIAINEKGNKEWRLYLSEYREDDNVPHLCKTRAVPGVMPEYLYDEAGQPAFSGFNLGVFFEKLDAALEKAMRDTANRFKNAPGLPKGIIGGPPASSLLDGNGSTAAGPASPPSPAQSAVPPAVKKPVPVAVRPKPSAIPSTRRS